MTAAPAPGRPVTVPGLVGHDREQPRLEPVAVAELIEPGVRLDEGVLHDVVGVGGTDHRGGYAAGDHLVHVDERVSDGP